MYAKLSKIERKLSTLDFEDLSLLEVDSSYEDYIHLLEKFVTKYGNSFRILEYLGPDVRDMLVLKLFLKLEHLTKEVRNKSLSGPARQALLLICETVRICLRDPMNLSKVQTEHAFHSLLNLYVKYRARVGLDIAISAGRCLYNVLNNNEERMSWFVYDLKTSMLVDALMYLSTLIESQPSSMRSRKRSDSSVAEGKEDEKDEVVSRGRLLSDDKSATDGDAKLSDSKPDSPHGSDINHTQYTQLLHYAVRICYMMACQSSTILQSLKNNFVLMKALVFRLAHCLVNNLEFSTATQNAINLADFPYTEENATLFIDISKLLYALDVYTQLDKCILYSESTIYLPHDFWVDYFTQEHARHHPSGGSSMSPFHSMEDISVHLLATESTDSTDIRQAEGKDDDSSSYRTKQDFKGDKACKDTAQSVAKEHAKEMEIASTELLNVVIAVVLSIGPYNCNLFIQVDKHASVYYTGKLADCEEYVLQLAMLCTDSSSRDIFSLQASGGSGNPGGGANNIVEMMLHRKAYLPNSIVRIMSRLLQKAKNIDASDRPALLTPVFIVATKMVKSHMHCYRATKNVLFPTSYSSLAVTCSPSSTSRKSASSNNVDPVDCPTGTIRFDVIKLMTSFDPNVKRCVAEFLFALCDDNVDEFIHRTGFGNAVALLKLKGLV